MKKKKIVLVAGGNGGVGFQCVNLFYKSGYEVIVIDKYKKNLNFFKSKKIQFYKSSLSSEKITMNLMKKILKNNGKVNILINCIGRFSRKSITSVSKKEIQNILNINLIYPMLLIKNFINIFNKDQSVKKIINIGSMAGVNGGVFAGDVYSISKAGIINLTKSVAKKYGKNNIICNCINPGPLESSMTKNWPKNVKKNLIHSFKLNRHSLGSTQEIAKICLFLASDSANYFQGSELNVNGGLII